MAKIIKLDFDEVVIAEDNKNLIHLPYEKLDFKPELNDEVVVYPDGDSYIVTKRENVSSSTDEMNIVNDNQQQQPNNVNDVETGKAVNKTVYIVLALLLGDLGAHKFYAGKTGTGILYFIFCLTLIPAILAIIDIIIALTKPTDSDGNIVV